jgi:hypothetical protein
MRTYIIIVMTTVLSLAVLFDCPYLTKVENPVSYYERSDNSDT